MIQYQAPRSDSAGGMPSGPTSDTDPWGNYVSKTPTSNYRFQTGNPTSGNPQLAQIGQRRDEFEQGQLDKGYMFGSGVDTRGNTRYENDRMNRGMPYYPHQGGDPYDMPRGGQRDRPSSTGGGLFGGFDLTDALNNAMGADTDISTTVADMNQQKKGKFADLMNFLTSMGVSQNSLTGNLASTGMQGVLGKLQAGLTKAQGDQNTAFASSQANAAMEQYANKANQFERLIGNVGPSHVGPKTQWNPMDLPDTDVTLASLMNQGQQQQQSVPQGQYGDPEPYYRRPDGVATRSYNRRSHMNRGANRPMSDYIPQSAYSDYA